MTEPAPAPPATSTASLDRETFRRIQRLAEHEAGLSIPDSKLGLVQSRLANRLRATGLAEYSDYTALVESPGGSGERIYMVSALTTNVSHFFREEHHFDALQAHLQTLQSEAEKPRIRIWSAGCSTGQEAYSIAMTILEQDQRPANTDIRVLATDIDRRVLNAAIAGIFSDQQAKSLPQHLRTRYFERVAGGYRASSQLRPLISFRELNLVASWPMRGPFDAIFCRNVIIYFSEETRNGLWPRFDAALARGGLLFLGHSERIADGGNSALVPAGLTTYRKSGSAGGPVNGKDREHGT